MGREIEITVRIDAPRADVWAAWTAPDHLANWLCDRASGSARPGEELIYEWEALNMRLPLRVVEAAPEEKLVMHAQPPGLAPQTQRIELASDGDATVVALTHAGFDDDDILRGTESGWRITTQVLKEYAERHFGRQRISAWMLGLAPTSFEHAYLRYTDSAGLRDWLSTSGALAPEGEPYALDLIDGGSMTGRVLARCDGREVALSWSEIRGVAAFRAFAAAPGALLVGVNMMSWGVEEEALIPAAKALEASVDRLVRALGGASATA